MRVEILQEQVREPPLVAHTYYYPANLPSRHRAWGFDVRRAYPSGM